MRKRFRAKKRGKHKTKFLKYIILFVVGFLLYFCFFLGKKFFPKNILKILLSENDSVELYMQKPQTYFKTFTNFLSGMDANQPVVILEDTLNYKKKVTQKQNKKFLYYKKEQQDNVEEKNFTVYIYSTHQTEGYQPGSFQDLNVTTDVFSASFALKEKLEALNITTIVEERKMSDYLKQNNFDYSKSYYASRYYLKDTLEKNSEISLVIDFHRDALSKELSTTTIDGKSYVKVMFVIGAASSNYQKIKENSTRMNEIIKNQYPTLTRGLFERNGAVYNQDVNENMLLLEVGGNNNTYDEVMNTVEILAPIIQTYLGGEK